MPISVFSGSPGLALPSKNVKNSCYGSVQQPKRLRAASLTQQTQDEPRPRTCASHCVLGAGEAVGGPSRGDWSVGCAEGKQPRRTGTATSVLGSIRPAGPAAGSAARPQLPGVGGHAVSSGPQPALSSGPPGHPERAPAPGFLDPWPESTPDLLREVGLRASPELYCVACEQSAGPVKPQRPVPVTPLTGSLPPWSGWVVRFQHCDCVSVGFGVGVGTSLSWSSGSPGPTHQIPVIGAGPDDDENPFSAWGWGECSTTLRLVGCSATPPSCGAQGHLGCGE